MSMDVTVGPRATAFATAFGKLAVALLFLEQAMRVYLNAASRSGQGIGPREAVTLRAGDCVPESSFTDSTSYKDLLVRYNQAVRQHYPDCVLDEELERVHEAVSTGRMSPLVSAETPFVLLKFGPPSNGTVEVTVAQPLSEGWLEQQFSHVMDEMSKVQAALRGRAK
jgi:hypothetical protein